ncbi:ABCC5 [Bugula neritina]|uniref:ABCC5 n=1 Tax=Bugula neritina TaxID=10212 RepID=A0A7J7KJ16_BUGNE|nr:ABCC5 [Bugula neritina]
MINNTQYVTSTLSERIVDNPRLSFYQTVYAVALILLLIVAYLTAHSYMAFCTCASTKVHDNIFRRTIASPMRFFDVTPSGQILNRFSKDMDEVDANFPFQSDLFFKNVSVILVGLVLILLASPWFLLTLIPIVGLVISLGRFSTAAIRQSKRIENVTKSPLFSHIAASVQGLSTIKAYKKENDFIERFHKLQDRNNMALLMHDSSTRWLSVRIDSVSLLIIISTFLLVTLVPLEGTTSAMAALALTYALSISDVAHYTLRLGIETDARLISAERIQNYVKNLESEAPAVIEHSRPERDWPKYGSIKFDNVNVRYREGLPLVLKNISLDIKPQEKIGIVGRTGSGKSSLALTLFRIMELDCGTITIDGVNISTIGLEDLRSKLSIIPQDPVLFMGTVRYNLDPFNKCTDKMLWSALQSCHIKHTIKSLDGQLDAVVTENGENFSVGERQLLCMARALLRHSKILVLDEATAAIDTEKDSLIQETIKEVFADCTMLTIAHRLNTVVNYDKILVLNNGEVMEFDKPENLLADRTSEFSKMMAAQESQKQNAQHRETFNVE